MPQEGPRPPGLVQAQVAAPVSMVETVHFGTDSVLEAWLIGTGSPIITPDRYGACTALKVDQQLILVDTGNGCTYRLAQLGFDLHDITHIFFTHHHLDHNADLGFLLVGAWATAPGDESWSAPLIVGPQGTLDYVNRVLAAQEQDIRARIAHGYDPDRLSAQVLEVGDGMTVSGSGWTSIAIEVDHRPVEHAFGYRFETSKTSIVVSGDTRPCDNLLSRARGADILVHEALYPGYGIPEYHTSSRDVGQVATRAGVQKLVLTHLIPGHLRDDVWLRDVEPTFAGEVVVGRDLMRVI